MHSISEYSELCSLKLFCLCKDLWWHNISPPTSPQNALESWGTPKQTWESVGSWEEGRFCCRNGSPCASGTTLLYTAQQFQHTVLRNEMKCCNFFSTLHNITHFCLWRVSWWCIFDVYNMAVSGVDYNIILQRFSAWLCIINSSTLCSYLSTNYATAGFFTAFTAGIIIAHTLKFSWKKCFWPLHLEEL